MGQPLGNLQSLLVQLTQIADVLWPLGHPKDVVVGLLNNTVGLLLKVWFGFILSTVDFETGGDFTRAATVQLLEPKVQLVADAALVLVVMWAAFRIMWGHGLFTQYTARILLPRLLMCAVLINFSQPMFQMFVDASNVVSKVIQDSVALDDPSRWWAGFASDPNVGAWQIVTTAALVLGYEVLAIAYLMRYAILIVLAVTAPLAGLVFLLPDTQHLSKLWLTHFTTNLFMQPAQLFVLAVGFAVERQGVSPIHHLFALAALLLVFKVPGALGGAEKAAHKLESTVSTAFKHMVHAVAKA